MSAHLVADEFSHPVITTPDKRMVARSPQNTVRVRPLMSMLQRFPPLVFLPEIEGEGDEQHDDEGSDTSSHRAMTLQGVELRGGSDTAFLKGNVF